MRIQVEYDENGQIISATGGNPVESPGRSGRVATAGHDLVEVEAEEIRHERDFDGLRKVVERYRVAGHPHEPHLVARDAAE